MNIYVYLLGGGGYEDKDESKSVQNRQQLNEFL